MKLLLLLLLPFTCLSQDTTYKELEKVVISKKASFIENKIDRTIIKVDGNPGAAGKNAFDLLRQSPGVMADASENLQIAGRGGVNVYIDDQPSQLSGQDLVQFLKNLDASNIRSFEILSSPGARYEASGNAGIIIIRLKKNPANGLNGNLSGSYVQSIHARGNAGARINYRKNRFYLSTGIDFNKGIQHTVANNDRNSDGVNYTQRTIEQDRFQGMTLRTGLSYTLSKDQQAGITWMINDKSTVMNNNGTSLVGIDSLITTRSTAPFSQSRNNINLSYQLSRRTGKYILNIDHTGFRSSLSNDLYNSSENNFDTFNFRQDIRIRLISVRLDHERELKNGWKLEAGTSNLNSNTLNQFDFSLTENIFASYISLQKKIKKVSIQPGLRMEHTARKDTGYLSLFPSMHVQYQASKNYQVSGSLNRRIDRPTFQDLNPFYYALDALNVEKGNPNLLPQITNSYELMLTYKYAHSVKLVYSKTTNYQEQVTYRDGKQTYMIPQNIGSKTMVSFSISTPLQPFNWWSLYLYAQPYYHRHIFTLDRFAEQTNSSFGFNSYVGNNFSLGKNWKAELSSWFNYQNSTTIYRAKPIGSINTSVQRSFMKEKIQLSLSVVDIFNTQRWKQIVETNGLLMTTYRKWESRNFTISCNFKFGNQKIRSEKQQETYVSDRIKER